MDIYGTLYINVTNSNFINVAAMCIEFHFILNHFINYLKSQIA